MQNLGYTLRAGITDQSASGISIIRKQLPDAEAISDIWHSLKTLSKLVVDVLDKYEKEALSTVKFAYHAYRKKTGKPPTTDALLGIFKIATVRGLRRLCPH